MGGEAACRSVHGLEGEGRPIDLQEHAAGFGFSGGRRGAQDRGEKEADQAQGSREHGETKGREEAEDQNQAGELARARAGMKSAIQADLKSARGVGDDVVEIVGNAHLGDSFDGGMFRRRVAPGGVQG